jgi:hypothetical protein
MNKRRQQKDLTLIRLSPLPRVPTSSVTLNQGNTKAVDSDSSQSEDVDTLANEVPVVTPDDNWLKNLGWDKAMFDSGRENAINTEIFDKGVRLKT